MQGSNHSQQGRREEEGSGRDRVNRNSLSGLQCTDKGKVEDGRVSEAGREREASAKDE
jgi:hypothetical protein